MTITDAELDEWEERVKKIPHMDVFDEMMIQLIADVRELKEEVIQEGFKRTTEIEKHRDALVKILDIRDLLHRNDEFVRDVPPYSFGCCPGKTEHEDDCKVKHMLVDNAKWLKEGDRPDAIL